jgi:hypothetical protein
MRYRHAVAISRLARYSIHHDNSRRRLRWQVAKKLGELPLELQETLTQMRKEGRKRNEGLTEGQFDRYTILWKSGRGFFS